MAWTTRVSVCVGLVLAGVADAGAQSPFVLDAVGRAIAADLDLTNGPPVLVVATYVPGGPADVGSDSTAAAALAAAFANARGIPVRDAEEGGTRCTWGPPRGDAPMGLAAQFYPPEFDDRTVRVMLSSGCLAQRRTGFANAFRQVHLFLLERTAAGSWEVVERRLLMIT